ncbi:MAG: arylsulfotransferase family protein [Streptosporangiaceae bacterium]
MTDEPSGAASDDASRGLSETPDALPETLGELPETLSRRKLFGLAGASAAGAAGLAASGCSALGIGTSKQSGSTQPAGTAQPAGSTKLTAFSAGPPFKSRPDLHPPHITLRRHGTPSDPRYIFLNAPYSGPGHGGTYIIDRHGHFVWFGPNTASQHRMNFSMQTYKGRPVLTWFRGLIVEGFGQGELVVADSSYNIKHVIRAHGGQLADFHEFVITPKNTALITIYRRHSPVDLRPVGGSASGYLVSGVAQEIDIATGKLLWEWDSWASTNPHVPLTESYQKLGDGGDGGDGTKASPYNYFHINSVSEVGDGSGDLLISGRNTFTIYRVKRTTGHIVWRLNGKKSNFTMGPRSKFFWQHHVRQVKPGMITVFDNGVPEEQHSRAIVLDVNTATKHVALKKAFFHPGSPQYQAGAMGSAQLLPDGRMFVGWGTQPHFSEFAPDGRLLLDADIIKGDASYRAFTQNWTGHPAQAPAAAARHRTGGATVYASWNGATQARSWAVFAGRSRGSLHRIAKVPKSGFETAIKVANRGPYFAVQALDGKGRALRKSPTVKIR